MFSFSDSKVNLVGALGRSFFEFPNSFQKHRENQKKKLRKNGNFYAKPVFDQIYFFIWFVDKIILDDQKLLKIEYKVPYEIKNTTLHFPQVFLQRNDNDLSSNDFKYLFMSKILENFTKEIRNRRE
ncbi:Uncharacterized protein FWK35_00013315, partial [Aphis craccivora]